MLHRVSRSRTHANALRRTFQCHQSAQLHLGRATSEGTASFTVNEGRQVHLCGRDRTPVTVKRLGLGSPYLWSKDMPRIEAMKQALKNRHCNFLQTRINPFVSSNPTNNDPEHKQTYAEALVLQELLEDEAIERNQVIVSALLSDTLLDPAPNAPGDRLSKAMIDRGMSQALSEMELETIDHVVCQIPTELLFESSETTLYSALQHATKALEHWCSTQKLQSFGFALPKVMTAAGAAGINHAIESVFSKLAEQTPRFASLQLPLPLNSSQVPLSQVLQSFQAEYNMTIVADQVFEITLDNGKPFQMKTYWDNHTGEDIAKLLKSAFNLAISVERKYMETILPANEAHRQQLPTVDDMAWAHILANQHDQFESLEEWMFVKETQILPRFQLTLQQLASVEATKDVGFAYSLALRELLKCFTASIQLTDAARAQALQTALHTTSLEQMAVQAALAAGADLVLCQNQVEPTAIALDNLYTPTELTKLKTAAAPFFKAQYEA